MPLHKKRFTNKEELVQHIKGHAPTFYYSSQTSTVIPYDKIESFLGQDSELIMGDLSGIPPKMELLDNGNLIVSGSVNWKDARDYLKSKGRNIMTAPTEDLALITAGAATSCTGERCFAFGNLRGQIHRIKYLDYNGEEKELLHEDTFTCESKNLAAYQEDFAAYANMKNGPFPRFEKAIDLMIGTEGQLGVITEVELYTTNNDQVSHLFMLMPKWEEDDRAHMEILEKIQGWRDEVILCELIDSNAFSYLPAEEQPNQGQDAIFFEIKTDAFERFYEEFIATLENIKEENIFEVSESKFHHIRASVPRHVFEVNSRMGVVKMGTDVQVNKEDFGKLLQIYRDFTKLNVRYNLFGHFGDSHLHFNYMPRPEQTPECQKQFEKMYDEVVTMKGSPFAEHGIGIIKQKYIRNFWGPNQPALFKDLKKEHDPHNQFFPQGFMHLQLD
jgi:FAD/FMN-containing dehydrogenase